MPQVPYNPVPDVAPSTQGTPTLRVDTPSEAFGVGVGRTIEGFGKGLEQDSDKIFQRAIALQELQNETDARNADAQASKEMGMLHADFQTKQGVNAGPEALEKYTNDLNAVYQKNRAALGNDDARRRYDSSALSVLNRSIFNGAGHSGQQVKEAAKGSAMAQIDAAADNVYNSSLYGDGTVGLDASIASARSAARSYSQLEGFTPEQAQEFENRQVSKIVSHLVSGIAQNQPQKAAELQNKYQDLIHGDDQIRVQNTVENRNNVIGARVEVDKILSPLQNLRGDEKPPTYKDLQAQVEAKAEELRPGDPLFKIAMNNQLEQQFNKIRYAQQRENFENKQTVDGAVIGLYSNGQIPQTAEELRNLPGVGDAWDKLSPAQQRHYNNIIAAQVRAGNRVDAAASLSARQEYVGMSQRDPQGFLDADIMSDKRLTIADKKYLFQQKQQINSRGEADPKLTHALQILSPDLRAAGYDAKTDQASHDQFSGILHDWMSSYLEEHKKRPGDKEIIEAGRRLLQTHSESRLFGLFSGTSEPMFRDTPSDDVIDRWNERRKILDPTAVPLTREQTIRDIAVEKLRRSMQKPSSGAEGE